MGNREPLNIRMKNYENIPKNYLTKKVPVIIRIDGKGFSNFTKGFKKPYDDILSLCMQRTMFKLCQEVANCKLGFTESDEISLLLTDYDKINTTAYFEYNIQKLASVTASMATTFFNQAIYNLLFDVNNLNLLDEKLHNFKYNELLKDKLFKANFDSRCFNLPKEEVTNYFIWRQASGTSNAIQGLGRKYFPFGEMQGKSNNEIKDILMKEYNIDFYKQKNSFINGICAYRIYDARLNRFRWVDDNNVPIFSKNKDYIEKFL